MTTKNNTRVLIKLGYYLLSALGISAFLIFCLVRLRRERRKFINLQRENLISDVVNEENDNNNNHNFNEINKNTENYGQKLIESLKRKKISISTQFLENQNFDIKMKNLVSSLFSNKNQIFIITKCDDDNEESKIKNLLIEKFEFIKNFPIHSLLFCSTIMGKAHIARHLEVDAHIDDDLEVLNFLKSFVPNLFLVQSNGEIVKY